MAASPRKAATNDEVPSLSLWNFARAFAVLSHLISPRDLDPAVLCLELLSVCLCVFLAGACVCACGRCVCVYC